MVKAVLFDLDGTLLNRDKSVEKYIVNQYDRLKDFIGHVPKDVYVHRFIELDCHGYVWKDKVYQQLTEEFKIQNITWDLLLQDYLDYFRFHCVPFADVKKMLVTLKNNHLLLGLITNGFGKFQMCNIKALGIEQYFDVILVSEWEGIKKPDPEIFHRALNKLDVTPGQSVFVGDHPVNDVLAAQYIGMKGIWKRNSDWEEVEADFTVKKLIEIPAIIRNLSNGKEGIDIKGIARKS